MLNGCVAEDRGPPYSYSHDFWEAHMARRCDLTGKRPNSANNVSHSHIKTKKKQNPNLQTRRIWWEEGDTFVKLKLSTRALRTLRKKSLNDFAKEAGIDLNKYTV